MESPIHPLCELFRQLGLPAEGPEIERFVATHRPLPYGTALPDAAFWSPAQSALLREGVHDDADWSETIDTLAVLLGD
jgi:hypothetical protein